MRAAAILFALLLPACGAAPRPPAAVPRGVLVVRSQAAATLWVDEHAIGEIGRMPGGVRLEAGRHRIELRLEGHHTRYAEATLRPDETQILELPLTEVQP